MAIDKGFDGAIVIGSDKMAHITEWELSPVIDALEKTSFSSSYDREYEYGLRNKTATFSGYRETTDAAQDALMDIMTGSSAPSTVTVILLSHKTTALKKGYTGTALLTGLPHGVAKEGLQTISGTLQFTGRLSTYSTA